MSQNSLRVAVLGYETLQDTRTGKPITFYRTVAVYNNQVCERLIRYSTFREFMNHLDRRDKKRIHNEFPKKKLTKKLSLRKDVIQSRLEKLDNYMKELSLLDLSNDSLDALEKLLFIGKYEKSKQVTKIYNYSRNIFIRHILPYYQKTISKQSTQNKQNIDSISNIIKSPLHSSKVNENNKNSNHTFVECKNGNAPSSSEINSFTSSASETSYDEKLNDMERNKIDKNIFSIKQEEITSFETLIDNQNNKVQELLMDKTRNTNTNDLQWYKENMKSSDIL